jgi:hypothetical protein
MAAGDKNRAVAREEGGGEADDAGFQASLNEQMKEVKLAAGRKPRKKVVQAALARERIAPWPTTKTKKAGWFASGRAATYIEEGPAGISLDEVIAEARQLSASSPVIAAPP